MLDSTTKKEKRNLEKDLLFYLSYYNEVTIREVQIKQHFDEQIEIIVEKLKEIGH
ncbi:hypothetical protein FACS189413_10310 [Bacteroidia bacterium]|nr:hypothetical protein FACS189413_10310 [Bacteroidia bacterium]